MTDTTISINDLETLLVLALRRRDLSNEEATVVSQEYVEAELEGRRTHGIGKFLTIGPAIQNRGKPQLADNGGATAAIDGQRELGFLVAHQAAHLAAHKASEFGVGLVVAHNFARYSRLKPHAKTIAERGFVGIALNSGGPSAVVPLGGREPILGTNPIAFGFPSEGEFPVLIDFATSKAVWGEIRQAMLEKRPLVPDTFVDSSGQVTQDPAAAEGVLPFDSVKGYALCIAIELLSALAPGATVGTRVKTEYDLGALFLAVSPDVFGGIYGAKVTDLVQQLHNSRPLHQESVRIPGERSRERLAAARQGGDVRVDSEVLRQLQRMSEGLEPEMSIDDKTN